MFKRDTSRAVVILCNVSVGRKIDLESLLNIFRHPTKEAVLYWRAPLDSFFNDDVPAEMIKRFIKINGISVERLAEVFYLMPEGYQDSRFKEMLDNGYFSDAV